MYKEYLNSTTAMNIRKLLQPIIDKHHVTAYIAGHEHNLQYREVNGVKLFISGGGSQLDDLVPTSDPMYDPDTTWAKRTRGFLSVVANKSGILYEMFNENQEVVYTTNTQFNSTYNPCWS
eukprot:TRINITY_DN11914_c0_g1_i6.p2 TRINITY_DN11914_c0_g1~~TRINITY_DN11914_c0_g1_i6.p2  ORF type:complete len:120 (-),score=39.29 TRINITY_DN11914_c0_g1_i6:331-690(-)